ncbi:MULTISPECIES: hypothetical protein [Streptomyces]|uniref:Uncharacterized protein n=1 Tax=Streptomyces tsukubensis (strain DSM 42081 / NBRC 108919 / NRRL 18488 / 9993) TaxID=1114943 RepID=I2MYX9_STRT9|nr:MULTISPECIES: hypothetical protein [Streptomyces]AZK94262.1 hypothetical protein B7R87_10590 [Streptomyces tsukubensis]EIF89976.1 hypothetical protein [Streptomyces tsukubensis NRRL18488]MYS66364.1 hypothetical protein [Streptomyces sp. SID5473]QKM69640.1 hypothetical protein STSU_023205 [Streptomyces tsukubensis NRRL18488]TAI46398.1 hypothetical protein EWI31_04950 [Streptomyces tsukubensis]
MTAASPRRALRALAVTTAALGAVLVSGSGAFADSSPSPAVKVEVAEKQKCTPLPEKGKDKSKPVVGKDGAIFCLQPADRDEVSRVVVPRGGVAAGERPATAQDGGNATTVIIGATAAALTIGAAGTVMIRRRTAHHDAR